MKKLITLLFAASIVTAASAQRSDRHRNDSRDDNKYQSSPYSNNDQRGYSNQYQYGDQYNRNPQWNERRDRDDFDRDRHERGERYEMMMRRHRAYRHDDWRYESYPYYGYSRRPVFQLSIGIGGHR